MANKILSVAAQCDQPMIQQTNRWRIGMGAALMLFALMAVLLTIISERPGNEMIAEGFGSFVDFKGEPFDIKNKGPNNGCVCKANCECASRECCVKAMQKEGELPNATEIGKMGGLQQSDLRKISVEVNAGKVNNTQEVLETAGEASAVAASQASLKNQVNELKSKNAALKAQLAAKSTATGSTATGSSKSATPSPSKPSPPAASTAKPSPPPASTAKPSPPPASTAKAAGSSDASEKATKDKLKKEASDIAAQTAAVEKQVDKAKENIAQNEKKLQTQENGLAAAEQQSLILAKQKHKTRSSASKNMAALATSDSLRPKKRPRIRAVLRDMRREKLSLRKTIDKYEKKLDGIMGEGRPNKAANSV